MQKIFSCSSEKIESKIQPLLDLGWKVKYMVAEEVAISMVQSAGDFAVKSTERIRGNIVIILEN